MKVGGPAAWSIALVIGQAVLVAGVVLLPWSDNQISGSSSAAEAGIGTGVIVAFTLAVGVALVLQPLAAVRRRTRWRMAARVAGLVCSSGAVLAAVGFIVTVSGTTVRAYGVDSAGNVNEPVARSHPGVGLWCAIALCLVALAVHARSPLPRRTGT